MNQTEQWVLMTVENYSTPQMPIHKLFSMALANNSALTKADFFKFLYSLEKKQVVDMQSHNTPFRITEKEWEGTDKNQYRGAVYYIATREQ